MIEKNSRDSYAAKIAYQDTSQASIYDQQRFSSYRGKIANYLDQRALIRALKHIPQSRSGPFRLLDIPCGTGRMTKFLLDKGKHVTGADISMEMMEVAKKKIQSQSNFGGFFQEDAANLTFPDNSFDCILSIRFIGHIPKNVRIEILKEFARVSDYVILEVSFKSRTAELRQKVDEYLKTGSKLPKRWSWHIFDKQELKQEVEQCGWKIAKIEAKLPILSNSNYVLLQR